MFVNKTPSSTWGLRGALNASLPIRASKKMQLKQYKDPMKASCNSYQPLLMFCVWPGGNKKTAGPAELSPGL